jgi:SAM-dependent methyltransferase
MFRAFERKAVATPADAELFGAETIYGDDFDERQVQEWYADEREAYAQLIRDSGRDYVYGYRALNELHGYRHLPPVHFARVLGIGSAYGDEFLPIIERIGRITIVESSGNFASTSVGGVACDYVAASKSGALPFHSAQFDLITCFGVLHHIPNVSAVLRELTRVLRPGGCMLVREPITSMGDWRRPRRGLTKRERGIPLERWDGLARSNGLAIVRRTLCLFPGIARLGDKLGIRAYNSAAVVKADRALCKWLGRNTAYHRTSLFDKCGPTSVFLLLRAV